MEDYSKLFNSEMEVEEARRVLYAAAEGKSKDERVQLLEAYDKALPEIVRYDSEKNRDFLK